MKYYLILIICLSVFTSFGQFSEMKTQTMDATWDQGVPLLPEDEYISGLVERLTYDSLLITNQHTDKESVKLCREIGIAFYNKGMYDAADWYLSRVKDYENHIDIGVINIKKSIDDIQNEEEKKISKSDLESLKKDESFLQGLPKSYENLSVDDLKSVMLKIDGQVNKLKMERDSLSQNNGDENIIKLKDGTIKTLEKEKNVIKLTIDKNKLSDEKRILGIEKKTLRTYIIWLGIIGSLLVLIILILLQRKRIKGQDVEIENQLKDINKKNTYLDHAARFIRHDMHSGINTYIPRGISSLEKRLTDDDIKKLKIESPLKMIKEGLLHTQKVYKNVYEFTNLVKQNSVLEKQMTDLTELLTNYVKNTSYSSQVEIFKLTTVEVNEILFCNAIGNLIKNGLKYNESTNKKIDIFIEDNFLIVQDNGIGLSQKQFDKICNTYNKKKDKDIDKDTYGLGLNICLAILNEHGFDLSCEINEIGTKMKINLNTKS